jgi:hypothetical protein
MHYSFQFRYLLLSYLLHLAAGRPFPCGGPRTAFPTASILLANDAAREIERLFFRAISEESATRNE